MPVIKFTTGSRTATRALEEFRTDFQSALVLAEPDLWAGRLGLVVTGKFKGKVTFPFPLDAAGYHVFSGEMKYRELYSRAMSFTTKKWQDGVKALAEIVELPDYIGWAEQPARMALEWRRQPNTLAAAVLEANPVLEFYRNPDTNAAGSRTLFASDHPFNVLQPALGSYNNDRTTTVAEIRSGKFFEDAAEYYASVKGPNGQPMGLTLDGGSVLFSLKRAALFKKALESDTLIRAISNTGVPDAIANVVAAVPDNNIYKGTVTRELGRELTSASDNYFYTFAAGLPGAHAFVVLQGDTPEEFIHDKSSEMYKKSLEIAYASVGDVNVAAAMPHTIARWQITG